MEDRGHGEAKRFRPLKATVELVYAELDYHVGDYVVWRNKELRETPSIAEDAPMFVISIDGNAEPCPQARVVAWDEHGEFDSYSIDVFRLRKLRDEDLED